LKKIKDYITILKVFALQMGFFELIDQIQLSILFGVFIPQHLMAVAHIHFPSLDVELFHSGHDL
jgi:hypothetical protein